MIRKHGHLTGSVEGFSDFLVRGTRLVHLDVAFALSHGTPHDLFHLLCGQLVGKRPRLLIPLFLVEYRLQVTSHMLFHGLFRILLHAGVYGGIYFQPVGI